jgi:DNA-binding IclR family transcriptional regulator
MQEPDPRAVAVWEAACGVADAHVALIDAVRAARRQALPVTDIAAAAAVTRQTVYRWLTD